MEALGEALDSASGADVIVTSGGASIGDHDLIRPALEAWGAEIDFWRVAIKPGKPLLVARRGATIILGLPGNPVSSYVTAFLFLLPLLRHLAGAGEALPSPVQMPLAKALPAGGQRLELVRARIAAGQVGPISEQDSSALRALAVSNAFIQREIDAPRAEIGELVSVYLL
jgi:molybdopterin molybdotransferase